MEENKTKTELFLFADGTFIYAENPVKSARNLLEMMKKVVRVVGYEINIQKSSVFLRIGNDISYMLIIKEK